MNLKRLLYLFFIGLAIICTWLSVQSNSTQSWKKISTSSFNENTDSTLVIWVGGCSHLEKDEYHGLSGLKTAFEQSEREDLSSWDIMLNLGDIASHPNLPSNSLAQLWNQQFDGLKKHKRGQVYSLMGNHDCTSPSEQEIENSWFRKYIDPFGKNTRYSNVDSTQRPYAIKGTYDRYYIDMGNLIIIMMSDRNDLPYPIGRGTSGKGFPAGAVTKEGFLWWKNIVESNQEKIIITCHHHMLKETTAGTGDFEGKDNKLHGSYSALDEKASSYIVYTGEYDKDLFSEYLKNNPNSIDLWLGAHTHLEPNATINGRHMIAEKYGVTFVNCGKLFSAGKKASSSRRFILSPSKNFLEMHVHDHSKNKITHKYHIPLKRNCKI